MISTKVKGGSALVGKTVLLSASVPSQERAERYRRVEDAAFEVEQAVISLARAVFSEGGRLVFGGHPAISPLVAMVVGEYREPRFAESHNERRAAPVEIYQSRVFDGHLPDDTTLMERLGYASIRWIDAVNEERFAPDAPAGVVQCIGSLKYMREVMLERSHPDAMVCIGGMDGLEDEVDLALKQPRRFPIYVLERTGGAAALLRERNEERLRMIDTEIVISVEQMRGRFSRAVELHGADRRRALVPYPLVMQTIVEEIARRA